MSEAGISGINSNCIPQKYCRMQLLIPAWDTCFRHKSLYMWMKIQGWFSIGTLKSKSHHDANFVVTGNTAGYHNNIQPVELVMTIWHHTNSQFFMMTSSNGDIFRVTGPLCGEFTGPGEFPAQRPVTRSFDVFLICARINDWVNKHEAGDLRHHRGHYDVNVM